MFIPVLKDLIKCTLYMVCFTFNMRAQKFFYGNLTEDDVYFLCSKQIKVTRYKFFLIMFSKDIKV